MTLKIKSKNKQNLGLLLNRLSKITIIKDGKVIYVGMERTELEWLFLSIIDFGKVLNIESKERILRIVFQRLAIAKNYREDYFFEQLSNEVNKHNSKKTKTLFLLTTLSVQNLPFRKINFQNCCINIHGNNFPKKFKQHRDSLIKENRYNNDHKDFIKLSVKINSRNILDAFEEAYQYLEVFRSFLCLQVNNTRETRFGDRSLKPINKIQFGEVLSIHDDSGMHDADNICLIVGNYQKPDSIRLNNDQTENLKKFTQWAIRKFKTCKPKHQSTLMKSLNLYVAAFDERNKHTCFLKAWTTLELLLNTNQNDILIRRSSSLYKDDIKPFKKQILESLRLFRNEYVHEGESSAENLSACFFAQEFIKDLVIKLNLFYAGFFNNIEDSNLFLDNLSLGISELQRKKIIADKAFRLEQRIASRKK